MLGNSFKKLPAPSRNPALQGEDQTERQLNACIDQLDALDLNLQERLRALGRDYPGAYQRVIDQARSCAVELDEHKRSWDKLFETYCELRERKVRQLTSQPAKAPSKQLLQLWEEMAEDEEEDYDTIKLASHYIKNDRSAIDLFYPKLLEFFREQIVLLDQEAWEDTQIMLVNVRALEHALAQECRESAPKANEPG